MTSTAVSYPDDPDDDARAGGEPRPASDEVGGRHDSAMLRDREAKALRLRRLGGTYDQIAVEMGFADASGARQLIIRALDRVVAEQVKGLRSLENQRLDVATAALMGVITDAKQATGARIRAVDAYVRLSARRSRLNGLDAPQQVVVSSGAVASAQDALTALQELILGEDGAYAPADPDADDESGSSPDDRDTAGEPPPGG